MHREGLKTLIEDIGSFAIKSIILATFVGIIIIVSIFIYKKSAVMDGYMEYRGEKYYLKLPQWK